MAMNFSQESMGAPYGGLGGLGGGLGGVGLVGLIGLNSFLGNRGLGFDGGYGPNQGGAAAIVTDKNVADIRQEIGALGNEIQGLLSKVLSVSFLQKLRSLGFYFLGSPDVRPSGLFFYF